MAALPQITVDLPIDPATFVSTPQATPSEDQGGVEKLDANGRHRRSFAFSQTGTFGETIAALDVLYLKQSDGKLWKADADLLEAAHGTMAIAYESGVDTNTKRIYSPGEIVSGFSFGVESAAVSETQDQSQTASTAATVENIYNTRKARQTFVTGDLTGNISRIDIYLSKVGTGGTGLTIDVYELDASGVKTGSSLGSKAIVSASLTTGAYNNFTFASAIVVKPRTQYVVEVTHTSSGGDVSNYWAINGSSSSSYERGGATDDADIGNNRASMTLDFAFKTYYTLQRNYYLGDNIYLSNTAGGLSINEGTNPSVVGIILSSSSILFMPGHSTRQLIGSCGFSNAQTSGTYYLGIPRNCGMVVAITSNSPSGGNGECMVFKYGKTDGYIGDSSNNIQLTWSGNEARFSTVNSALHTVRCYFYRT